MKNLICVLTILIATASWGQTTNPIELEKAKLKLAKDYSDHEIAISSIYSIIALEGPQSTYKDSLAYLYFSNRKNVSCFLIIDDILQYKPGNTELMEMKAISLESMGAIDKSREAYVELLAITNSNYHAYKLAGLLFKMGKNDEAYTMIKEAGQKPDDGTIQVTFQVNKNYNQNVSLKSAIAYVEGLIALALEKNKEAKESFENAIALFPDFVLAKSKLTTLEISEEK
jgi:tetratricopeptide (TPR) repeat protein